MDSLSIASATILVADLSTPVPDLAFTLRADSGPAQSNRGTPDVQQGSSNGTAEAYSSRARELPRSPDLSSECESVTIVDTSSIDATQSSQGSPDEEEAEQEALRPRWYHASKEFNEAAHRTYKSRNSSSTVVETVESHNLKLESDFVTASSTYNAMSKEQQQELMDWIHQPLPQLIHRLVYDALLRNDTDILNHFLWTYRCFTTPRSVLLGFIVKLREITSKDNTEPIVMLAKFKLCSVLDKWINAFPHDFYAKGTSSVLSSLLTHIKKAGIYHYAADLIPFTEKVKQAASNADYSQDLERDWAFRDRNADADSDSESETSSGHEHDGTTLTKEQHQLLPPLLPQTRDRSGSTPRQFSFTPNQNGTAESTLSTLTSPSTSPIIAPRKLSGATVTEHSPPEYPKDKGEAGDGWWQNTLTRRGRSSALAQNVIRHLQSTSTRFLDLLPTDVAEQITKIQLELFVKIEPRDWIRHVVDKPKASNHEYPEAGGATTPQETWQDPVRAFSRFYNQLGGWVTSLILAPDKIHNRVRIFSRMTEVAKGLRQHGNYSGLRAVVAGIMNSTYEGDRMQEMFQEQQKSLAEALNKYEKLMSSSRSHWRYRLTLSEATGALIPEAEIHTSDLERLHSVNPNFSRTEPDKVNWGKFSGMGRVVGELSKHRERCKRAMSDPSGPMHFSERKEIRRLIVKAEIMDAELLQLRIPPPESLDLPKAVPAAESISTGGLKRLANILR